MSKFGLSLEEMKSTAPAIFATEPSPNVGNKYGFVPTYKMLERLKEEGYYPTKVSQKGRSPFGKHMIRLLHRDALAEKMETDVGTLLPQAILINSHDTTASFNMMMGIFRLVCSNGMIVSQGPVEKKKFRHVSIEEEVLVSVGEIVEHLPLVVDDANQMRGLKMSQSIIQSFAEEAIGLRFDFDVEPEKVLVPRRTFDEGNDLWSVLSRVQENLMRGGFEITRKKPVTSQEVTNVDMDVKINRGLWDLAKRYQEQMTA